MKRRNSTPVQVGIAFCSLQLQASGTLQLMPAGQFNAPRGAMAGKGPWFIDDESVLAVLKRVQSRQNDIVIDYEHQTLKAAENGQPAPAAGWINPQNVHWVAGKGLMVSDPNWTPKAKEFFSNDEYRYLSPVFSYHPKTGQVLDLINVAVTNQPAIDGMDKVMLAAASLLPQPQQEDASMNEETLKLLRQMFGLAADADESAVTAALTAANQQVTNMATTLALKDATGFAALSAIGDALTGLKKTADNAEEAIAAASIATPDSALKVITDLNGQVAALTARLDGNDKDALIAAAKSQGKLMPSMEEWAEEQPVEVLKSYFKSAPAIAALTGKQTTTQQVDDDGNPVLSEAQLAVCSQMGIDPAEYAKQLTGDK